MAKKRALIDAVLSATRSSGLFTQDIEDEEPHQFSEKQFSLSHQQQKPSKTVPASDSQLKFIYNLVSINRIPINTVKNIIQNRYNVTESKLLSNDQASDLISYLKNYSSDRKNQAVRMA